MSPRPRSLELLSSVNPVPVDRSLGAGAQASAALQRILAEPRESSPAPGARQAASRWHPRLALSGLLATAGAVAALIAVLVSASSPAPAFAGWSARPAVAAPARVSTVLRRCNALVPLVVAERRGPYTAALFGSRYGGVACVLGPSMSFAGTVGDGIGQASVVAADQIQMSVATGADSSGQDFVLLAGRIGSAVTRVTIRSRNGGAIVASVRDGWYLAWWPARVRALDAIVTTGHRSRTVALPAAARKRLSCAAPSGEHAICAEAGGGSGSSGAGLIAGPPIVGPTLAKPFGSVVLFVVYSASRVQLCWHPGPPLPTIDMRKAPATDCIHAQLLTRLPRSYPVQRNLLDMFHDSVWQARLPRGAARHGEFTAYVTAFGIARRWGKSFGVLSVSR